MPKLLITIGLLLTITGLLWHFFPGLFSALGRLPGDLRFESERVRVYFPIVTMIIISVVITVILNLFQR